MLIIIINKKILTLINKDILLALIDKIYYKS